MSMITITHEAALDFEDASTYKRTIEDDKRDEERLKKLDLVSATLELLNDEQKNLFRERAISEMTISFDEWSDDKLREFDEFFTAWIFETLEEKAKCRAKALKEMKSNKWAEELYFY